MAGRGHIKETDRMKKQEYGSSSFKNQAVGPGDFVVRWEVLIWSIRESFQHNGQVFPSRIDSSPSRNFGTTNLCVFNIIQQVLELI